MTQQSRLALSRRKFLRLAGVGVFQLMLAACGRRARPAPT